MSFILTIVALLTVAGSWAGWRRSPLYSVKTTIKIIGAMVLIVAIVLGLSFAVFDGPLRQSPTGQVIVGICALLVVTTGSMVSIIRITDSHVATLPPNAQLETLHRRNTLKWIWRFVAYLAICGAAALAVPTDWQWLPEMLGGFPLLVCGPLLTILYMMARRNDRGMTAVIAEPWVHWQYPAAQWEEWAKNQRAWKRSKMGTARANWNVALILCGVCLALFSLGAWMNDGTLREKVGIVAALEGFIILFFGTILVVGRGAAERWYRRIAAAPPESYFGEEGFYCNGEYMPWVLSGQYLVEALYAGGVVTLTFESFNGSSSTLIVKRVPVPDGSDLAILQQRLRARCKTASVKLAG